MVDINGFILYCLYLQGDIECLPEYKPEVSTFGIPPEENILFNGSTSDISSIGDYDQTGLVKIRINMLICDFMSTLYHLECCFQKAADSCYLTLFRYRQNNNRNTNLCSTHKITQSYSKQSRILAYM